jgi:hypothetical protein
VDEDVAPGGDGLSWATAYQGLQSALADAVADSTVKEIRVAAGVYTPAGPAGDRQATFQLVSGVSVMGGYAGFGAADANLRDVDSNASILSGDLNRDDDSGGDNSENSYHVVKGGGVDATAILDGFTITAGHANGPTGPDRQGAGMYNNTGSPVVANCAFVANVAAGSSAAGGGMYNIGATPLLVNCVFNANQATGSFANGGGLYAINSSPSITNCSFANNSAVLFGGGIYLNTGTATIINSILWNNSAPSGTTNEAAQIRVITGTVNLDYSCVQGLTGTLGGTGNIGDDPLFAAADDLHLQDASPAINAADNSAPDLPATDRDGADRIQQCRVDMGAYESAAPPAAFPDCNNNTILDDCDILDNTSEDCNGDLVPDECRFLGGDYDADGDVDLDDYAEMADCLAGPDAAPAPPAPECVDACLSVFDWDDDGDVDLDDYADFSEAFTG